MRRRFQLCEQVCGVHRKEHGVSGVGETGWVWPLRHDLLACLVLQCWEAGTDKVLTVG